MNIPILFHHPANKARVEEATADHSHLRESLMTLTHLINDLRSPKTLIPSSLDLYSVV